MIDYTGFFEYINGNKLGKYSNYFKRKFNDAFVINSDTEKWKKAIENLPPLFSAKSDFNQSAITIGTPEDSSQKERKELRKQLMQLHPWRKGPYNIFGVFIDSEWRSDWKWDRLKNHISPLKDKKILDVGSGNGYHCWRMLGAGARNVIGIDPYMMSIYQFMAINTFVKSNKLWLLPMRLEEMPKQTKFFDTVFSMGVLYHRRSPFDHLYELRDALHNDGELILETLIINGKQGETLVPVGRYAQMRNIWFIPSALTLELWLKKSGFKNIRLINVTETTTQEQRKTEWMTFDSLSDFLSPTNPNKTVEGYPAPKRAIFIANAQ
jgi:tRNA (mo5U34)-methyltransferase